MRQKTLVPLQKMASIFHIWHFHREIGMENQTNLPVIAHHGVIGLSWERASFPAWTHTSIFIHTQGGTCANTITPNSSIFLSHTHIRQICSVHQHILAADIHISISCLSSSSVFYFSPHILHLWYIFAKQNKGVGVFQLFRKFGLST